MDPLHQAIHCGKKVSFRYFSYVYSPNGTGRWKKEYHHNGQFSVVSPYALVWDDENYYLVGYYERRETVSHFRVDKMEDIRILSDWARPAPAHFVVGDYVGRTFGMFGGNQTQVTLEAENDLMNVFYDRFGKDLTPHRVDVALSGGGAAGIQRPFLVGIPQLAGRWTVTSPRRPRTKWPVWPAGFARRVRGKIFIALFLKMRYTYEKKVGAFVP